MLNISGSRDSDRFPADEQTTPGERTAAEAATKLIHLADSVTRSLEGTFGRFGVTGPQYNVLRILRGAGQPLPTMELAKRMLQKTPGVTGILDRLQDKELVRRERSSTDRRVWLCSITDNGLDLLAEMDEAVRRANQEAFQGAREDDLRGLTRLLERIEQALQSDEE